MNTEDLELPVETESEPEAKAILPEKLDDIVILNGKKERKLSDILTSQCILCILLAIVLLVLNISLPKYSEMILIEYSSESSAESPLNQALTALVEKISAFLNSSPNDRT